MAASRTVPERGRPEQLLEGCLAGDASAFEDFMALCGERLFAFIAGMTGDVNLAGDIFRRVVAAAAGEAASRDGGMSFTVWLYRIAGDAVADELRGPPVPAAPGGGGSGRSENHDRMEPREIIRAALAELPFDQRAAFLLKEAAELAFDEIGAVLDCGRETAKNRFLLAVEGLRSGMDDA